MNDVDRTAVVMSIRAKYADLLMAGSKTVEFRKKPLPGTVTTALVYRSGPPKVRGVVGLLRIVDCRATTARTVQARAAERGYRIGQVDPLYGISGADLAAYAGGWDAPLYGLSVEVVAVFPEPLALWEVGTLVAPQSWRYAHENWRQALTAAHA